jgi:frataxin-like iron-binding protein CyaY
MFTSQVFSDGIACNNASFSDPARGFTKYCWYQSTTAISPVGGGGNGGTMGGGTGSGTSTCDLYASGGTPCVAAHSTVRALYGGYGGRLYQVKRASDGTTQDIGTLSTGGFANAAAQDSFCPKTTTCTITMIYDQSPQHNDLSIEGPGGNVRTADSGAVANALPIKVNGNNVYGVKVTSGVGYRDNLANGLAKKLGTNLVGSRPEGIYMVTSGTFVNNPCCFDYGNAETSSNDDGFGRMDALNFTTWCQAGPGLCGTGPFVEADLENGQYFSDSTVNPNSSTFHFNSDFVTAMLKNDGQTTFALKGGNAQSGSLITEWNGLLPPQYQNNMGQEGAIVLGTGGDNSDSGVGSFFEGAITIGYPTDAAENAVQANIVAAGYTGNSGGSGGLVSEPPGPYTGPSDPNGPGPQDGFASTATEQPNVLMGSKPAVVSFHGSLYEAFQANDASHTLFVTSSPTGLNFPAAAPQPAVQIGSAPAMAVFDDQVFIAFQANDASHQLFVTSSPTGTNFPHAAPYSNLLLGNAPAMAVFNSQLYMAFQANDASHTLFVTSSPDGVNWPAAHPINNVKIGSAPAMAVFNSKLYVAFRANDASNEVWIASSSDGVNFSSRVVLSGQMMAEGSSPALVVSNNVLYYIYGANDTFNEMLVTASTDGETWQGPKAYLGVQMGLAGPGAAAFGNGVSVSFQSNDSRNVLFVTGKATEANTYTGPSDPGGPGPQDGFAAAASQQTNVTLGSKPALASFNGTLYASFQANDPSHTLFVTSSNGANFPHATPYPDITIGSAPAMAEFDSQLWIAFQANDPSHQLFVTSSSTGTGFPHATPYSNLILGSAPAMAGFNNQLYMAFQANDPSHTLFVTSSPDGVTWPSAHPIPNVAIGSAPAMISFNGKIYVAFRANDASNEVWIASSSDGVNFSSQVLAGQTMGGSSSPALTVYNNTLYLIYGANDAANEMLVTASTDGETWQGPKAYLGVQIGATGPAATAFGNGVYVAFQSNDARNALYVTTDAVALTGVSSSGSFLQSSFASPATQEANIVLGSKPAFASINERLYMAFRGNGTAGQLFVASSPPAPGLGFPTANLYSNIKLPNGPAMAAFNNQLFIAFQANDASHQLFVTSATASGPPGSLLPFPPATPYPNILLGNSPAMAVFNNELYLAFQANDSSNTLFVTSSPDGVTWPDATQIPNVQMGGVPSMTTFNGKLYVAFRANDKTNDAFIASSSDGVHFTSQDLFEPITQGTLPSDPTLVAYNNTLYYIYTSSRSVPSTLTDVLTVMTSTDGVNWSAPAFYPGIQVGAAGPAAAAFINGVYVGFASDDSRVILFMTNNVGNN